MSLTLKKLMIGSCQSVLIFLLAGCDHTSSYQYSPPRYSTPDTPQQGQILNIPSTVHRNKATILRLHNLFVSRRYPELREQISQYFINRRSEELGDLFNEKPEFCLELLSVSIKYKEAYFAELWQIAYDNQNHPKVLKMMDYYKIAWNDDKCRGPFVEAMRLYLDNRRINLKKLTVRRCKVLSYIF